MELGLTPRVEIPAELEPLLQRGTPEPLETPEMLEVPVIQGLLQLVFAELLVVAREAVGVMVVLAAMVALREL